MGSRPRNKVATLAQCSRLLQRLDLGLSVAEFTQNLFGVLPDLGWWPRNARFGEAKADGIVDSARHFRIGRLGKDAGMFCLFVINHIDYAADHAEWDAG